MFWSCQKKNNPVIYLKTFFTGELFLDRSKMRSFGEECVIISAKTVFRLQKICGFTWQKKKYVEKKFHLEKKKFTLENIWESFFPRCEKV